MARPARMLSESYYDQIMSDDHYPYLLYLAEVAIGFNPTTYFVSEDQGSVSVAVSLLSEILARDVIVSLQTINGMAVGESLNNFACMLKGFVATFVMLTGVISPLN